MRIGLLGSADGDEAALDEPIDFLLSDAGVDQLVYLGADDAADRWVRARASALFGAPTFFAAVARAAENGTPKDIDALIAAAPEARALERIRTLPPPPARAVELVDDRVVLLVHDKAVLDEDDIANAHLVVYGRSRAVDLKRFGPRLFFTPGPAQGEKVAILEQRDDGPLSLALFDISGAPEWTELMPGRAGRISITG